jgi:hypothetical protein
MTIAQTNFAGLKDDASGTTLSTSGLTTVTGRLVVVGVRYEGGTTSDTNTVGISDNASNTYTQIGTGLTNTTSDARIHLFYCLSITGNAALVVTATLANARTYRNFAVCEYSYAGTLYKNDSNSAQGSATTSPTCGSVTAANGDLVVGFLGNYSSRTLTAAAGYTKRENSMTLGHYLEQVVSSAGAYNPSGTFNSADIYVGYSALFSESPPASASIAPLAAYYARPHGTLIHPSGFGRR